MIQIFTVIAQVGFVSILGVYNRYGIDSQFIAEYLQVYCKNFIMALPVQLFIVGPISRVVFRRIFSKEKSLGKEKIR